MNRVKVTVAGKDYVLQTREEERYVVNLAKVLDHKIGEILELNDSMSLTTACVLVGMDVLDEATKINSETDRLRFQLKDYVEQAAQSSSRIRELEKKVQILEKENQELWHEIEISTETTK